MTQATICEIIKDEKILLQYKAAGKFGEGKWNGPGGKIKPEETPLEGVIREVKEETTLTIALDGVVGVTEFAQQDTRFVMLFMKGHLISGEVNLSDEHEDYVWLEPAGFHLKKIIPTISNVLTNLSIT